MDATVAYRQSCLRVIEYLRRYGYSDYQIYLMLSCIPIEGHVAGIVDVRPHTYSFPLPNRYANQPVQIPNACTTIGLPMDIFDFDISPGAEVKKLDLGKCAMSSS